MSRKDIEAYRADHPRCEVCGDSQIHTHHIRTRGAGGRDSRVNLINLCPVHHTEVHTIGRDRFAQRYGLADRFARAMKEPRHD